MKKYSKRVHYLKKLLIKDIYPFEEGISLVKTLGNANFCESIEAHFSLNLDSKDSSQQLRNSLILPSGSSKKLRIGIFSDREEDQNLRSENVFVGFEELLAEILNSNNKFNVLLTRPEFMPKLTKFGKILGPKGLMPSPKSGTVSDNLESAVRDFEMGKIEYKSDKTGCIHLAFGNQNFSEANLINNFLSIYNSIDKNKPSKTKGKFFKSIYICTTMGPSIKISLNSLKINSYL